MSVKVAIKNLPEVQKAFANIPGKLGDELRHASAQARRLLIAELARYPAPRPGQRYIRTMRLGRGWHRASPVVGAKGFELVNPVEHTQFPQGDRQAWMHRGRWKPASQIAHEHEEDVREFFETAAQKATE